MSDLMIIAIAVLVSSLSMTAQYIYENDDSNKNGERLQLYLIFCSTVIIFLKGAL